MTWKAFPLHPETPPEGQLLEDLFRTSSEKIQTMVEGLQHTASQLGLDFGTRTRTYNSRLAQELGCWAEEMGRGSDFHHAAFRAYFVDGRNLADHDVLLGLVRQVGLPEGDAQNILVDRAYAPAVDADWQLSRQLGVRAVPTFMIDGQALVGARSYRELSDMVTLAGAAAR